MSVQSVQNSQYQAVAPQPNYNAVKIDINNPQVNVPNTKAYRQNNEKPTESPVYSSVPAASVYEVPLP